MDTIIEKIESLKDKRIALDDALADTKRDPIVKAAEDLASSVEDVEDELNEVRESQKNRDTAMAHLETRYPRLFSGDLSKLDWSERRDLFEALSRVEFTVNRTSDEERTIERIDGKLR